MDFRQLLGQENVYDGLTTANAELDMQGWVAAGFRQTVEDVVASLPHECSLIEVGSWKGASTNIIADTLKAAGKRGQLLAVDTWLGAPEFWTPAGLRDPTRGLALDRRNGFPRVYEVFLKNAVLRGNHDVITPFPLSSVQAAAVLAHGQVAVDAIYVDASHEEDAVFADLSAYWGLLKPGGIMFGDDFNWDGVHHAVTRFAASRCVEARLPHDDVVWQIRKP